MPQTTLTSPSQLDAAATRRPDVHQLILLALLSWTVLAWAGQMHLVWRDSLVNAVDLLFDDAYYYLGVAWNLAHGHGSKFTEPLATNGYHPLWLLLLAGLTALFGLSKMGLFCAALTLTAAIKCLGIWLFGRGDANAVRRSAGRLAVFVAMVKFPMVFSAGMETTLFVLFIPWLLQLAKAPAWAPRHALAVGALASLVFLTRIDALALGAVVLLAALATRRVGWRGAGLALLPLVLTAACYAAINFHAFGTPLPVSGQAKAIGAPFASNLATSGDFFSLRWAGLMLLVWAAVRFTVAPRLAIDGFALVCLALTLGICALYYGAMSGWPIWPWYLYTTAFVTVYASAAGFHAIATATAWVHNAAPAGRRRRSVGAAIGVAALAVASVYLGRIVQADDLVRPHLLQHYWENDARHDGQPAVRDPQRSSFNRENVALLPWLAARYPGGATIAMGDRAGGLGYWMPQQFQMVQTEGLVADKAFLQVLKTGTLPAYLDRHANLYLADVPRTVSAGGIVAFVEPVQPRMTAGPLNVLCFRQADALLAQDYLWDDAPQQRFVFDLHQRLACPADLVARFAAAKARFDGVRHLFGFF